jgi:hypothetical protein
MLVAMCVPHHSGPSLDEVEKTATSVAIEEH